MTITSGAGARWRLGLLAVAFLTLFCWAPTAFAQPGTGAEPARVSAPSIGLDEPLIPLDVTADGTMAVPADYDRAGWFVGGGRPGGRGPTVIAGHVDSLSGPAVFARLRELAVGAGVSVTGVDGSVTDYVVTEVIDVPKAAFPTARVFGALPHDELRLVTCSGYFDRAAASYEDNRVVFAVRR